MRSWSPRQQRPQSQLLDGEWITFDSSDSAHETISPTCLTVVSFDAEA